MVTPSFNVSLLTFEQLFLTKVNYYAYVTSKVDEPWRLSWIDRNIWIFYFTSVSQIVEFPYKRVPRPKIDYVKNIDTLALSCKFDFPALGNVSFAVEWFADGKLIRTQQMCVEDKGSRCKMDDLEFTINYGVFEMGQNVSALPHAVIVLF